jgi:tripartite-type tricarboxylate transporter receptor subunit TctC
MSTWYAIWAPKGTPPEVIARMSKELRTAMATAAIKDAWARNGSEVPDMMGADFGKFVNSEIARWGSVVKEAGVKLE